MNSNLYRPSEAGIAKAIELCDEDKFTPQALQEILEEEARLFSPSVTGIPMLENALISRIGPIFVDAMGTAMIEDCNRANK